MVEVAAEHRKQEVQILYNSAAKFLLFLVLK